MLALIPPLNYSLIGYLRDNATGQNIQRFGVGQALRRRLTTRWRQGAGLLRSTTENS